MESENTQTYQRMDGWTNTHCASNSRATGSRDGLVRQELGDQVLQGVDGPLAQVVRVEQLQLPEQLDQEVRAGLILGDEGGHLRVDGLT